MNETYIEFLVEDKSGKILLEQILGKYCGSFNYLNYNIHGFKGIGGIPKSTKKLKDLKTRKLLNDLPMYLKGFDKSLKTYPYKKAVVVVLDCDDRNCVEFNQQLKDLAKSLELSIDTFFCIAIEEMEAWLLGDINAIISAYPSAKKPPLTNYRPDSIVGTWEHLADSVFPGGATKLKKNAVSYYEIGEQKCKWAKEIGAYMDLKRNTSPSFNYFLSRLDRICN